MFPLPELVHRRAGRAAPRARATRGWVLEISRDAPAGAGVGRRFAFDR
jgi:hypothetical protein